MNDFAGSLGPCPSLSVTLVIGITSMPTFDPAPSDMLELTRDMRQIRTFPCPLSMHNYASSRAIGAGTAVLIVGPELRSRA